MKIIPNPSCLRSRSSKLHFILLFIAVFMVIRTACAQDLGSIGSQKAIQFNGNLEAGSTIYSASGIPNRRQPFSYLLNGSAAFSIYGMSVPFSVSYTQSQSAFSQPFNQFGMSPTYKWITAHMGYRSIEYSPYTLAGHTMLGAGFDLTPGKWQVGLMYGRLNSATRVDTTSQSLVPYAFSRKAVAVKLGYGSVANFFQMSYLSAHDDSLSVPRSSIPSAVFIPPAANYVLGYNSRFTIAKYFIFENQGGVSAYTRDVNSSYTLDAVKNSIIQKMGRYFRINGTTELYKAFTSSLGFETNKIGVKVTYKRIDPDFQSMGAYFLNSDAESWSVDPRMNLFKNKLRMSGSLGFQHDNLLQQKRSTSYRVISAANVNADITSSFAVNGTYSNFSNDQQPNTVRYPDSLRVVQTTHNMMLTPRFTIVRETTVQLISLSASKSQLNDLNKVITNNQVLNRSINTSQYFINYTISFPKSNFGIFANLNHTALQSKELNNTYQGASLGGYANLFQNKLQVNLHNSLTMGKGQVITNTATASYRMFKNQVLKTSMYLTNSHPELGSSQTPFTEFRNELSYLFNF